jgi:hypothetical protein
VFVSPEWPVRQPFDKIYKSCR